MTIIGSEDHNDELLPTESIFSHNSCVDFSFLTETENSNTRRLTRLNGLFHYMADRKTGGLRADKLHDLIISAGCSDFTTLRLESFLFPKLEADGVEVLKKQRRLFGKTARTEVDVRIISRGPFLSIFKDETMQSVNNLVQSAAAIKAKKEQWHLDKLDQLSSSSHDGSFDRTTLLKDSRTVKTEPALFSSSNWKNTSTPAEKQKISTNTVQNEDSSEIILCPIGTDNSPSKLKHELSQADTDASVKKSQRRKKNRSKRKKKSNRSKEHPINQDVPNHYPNNEVFSTQRHAGNYCTSLSNNHPFYQESKGVYGYDHMHVKSHDKGNNRMKRNCKSVVKNCLEANHHPINMDDKVWRKMLVQQQQHALERTRREVNGDICFLGGFAKFVKTLLTSRNDIIH